MQKPRLVIILGPTASGKSDVAVEAAKLLHGEVVSADSRQVYRGLDLGTGKITTDEMQGIPHHLLDVANPEDIFTVTDYKKLAEAAIEDIVSRGKLPILAGGTGLYIDTLVNNLEIPEVPPNPELRDKLSETSTHELFKILSELDPERAATIDKHNPRRLVRAIEIAEALGKVPPLTYESTKYDPLFIGVSLPKDILELRIKRRLRSRIERGMIQEAEQLHAKGLSWERMESLGLEYKYLALHLQGKLSAEEMETELAKAIIDYTKRQMTWFKKNPRIIWLTPPEILPYLQAHVESH